MTTLLSYFRKLKSTIWILTNHLQPCNMFICSQMIWLLMGTNRPADTELPSHNIWIIHTAMPWKSHYDSTRGSQAFTKHHPILRIPNHKANISQIICIIHILDCHHSISYISKGLCTLSMLLCQPPTGPWYPLHTPLWHQQVTRVLVPLPTSHFLLGTFYE